MRVVAPLCLLWLVPFVLSACASSSESASATATPLPQQQSASSVWATAAGGVLLRSSDGGATWDTGSGAPFFASPLILIDDSHAWAIGGRGDDGDSICWTHDAGLTWDSTDPWPKLRLYDLTATSRDVMWAVGGGYQGEDDRAAVLRSSDGGATWSKRNIPDCPPFVRATFPTKDSGWAVGGFGPGRLYFSLDGGRQWLPVSSLADSVDAIDVVFADALHGWMIGNVSGAGSDSAAQGVVYATSDGGQRWARQASGLQLPGVRAVFCLDERSAWVVGNEGLLLGTSDGGASWQRLDAGTTKDLVSVVFANQKMGWIVAREATVLRTVDGGATWTATTWDPEKVRLTDAIGVWTE